MFRLRADEISWRQIDDEIVALDARAGSYLSISGAGTLLWPALVTGATPEQLAQILIRAYEINEARARADVADFVSSLAAQDLLVA
jgi:Coenzyme PQQ synthesis protein D (PqqD)